MQFYRKWINVKNDNYKNDPNNQIVAFYKKLGFVALDGSELVGTQTQTMRWRYDNWQTTSRKNIGWTQGGYTIETNHRYGVFNFSDGRSRQVTPHWETSVLNAYIGFPLKNRGFYIMTCTDPSSGGSSPLLTPDYPPKLIRPHQQLSSNWKIFGLYTIGYYNNLMNEFNYLVMDEAVTYMDYNYGVIKGAIWDSSGSYTDGKKNICTLIKYPTQDGFMDNLYLISTSPNTVTDGYSMSNKFFSFGGRNFYCSDYNLVFELPAN